MFIEQNQYLNVDGSIFKCPLDKKILRLCEITGGNERLTSVFFFGESCTRLLVPINYSFYFI